MARSRSNSGSDSREVYRCWVEVRALDTGSIRALPLEAYSLVKLVAAKGKDDPTPETRLRIVDDNGALECATFDEIRLQLRERYPDDKFERTIHYERDLEAEQRRSRALDELARIIAGAALERMLKESEAQNTGDLP